MTITAVFTNEENTQIKWTNEQGKVWYVPYPFVDGEIPRAVQEWVNQGNSILPYSPASLTAVDVKNEAQRRINALFGAADLNTSLVKQSNAQMRAIELTNILHQRAHTSEEATEAAALQDIADAVKVIRAKSDEIEAMNPIPSDYATNDSYWS